MLYTKVKQFIFVEILMRKQILSVAVQFENHKIQTNKE